MDLAFTLVAIVVIIVTALVGGLIPFRLRSSEDSERWLALGNALAGGIFLGAALLHLLPDSAELLGDIDLPDYPWSTLLAGLGFLLVLLLEEAVASGREDEDIVAADASVPVVLFLVLSVHSVIAGTALGLEQGFTASIALLVAILAHKGFAAFALGVSLASTGASARSAVRAILAFAVMTPIGIIAGTTFSAVLEADATILLEGIFDGLATGTFLYIGATQIFAVYQRPRAGRIALFGMVVAGAGVMALLAVWA